jgi:hypothetical protein
MKHFIALAIAAALFSAPATAQTKGRSATAPGFAGTTPGQKQITWKSIFGVKWTATDAPTEEARRMPLAKKFRQPHACQLFSLRQI